MLLLDLYEKMSIGSKRRADLEKIVVSLVLITVNLQSFRDKQERELG